MVLSTVLSHCPPKGEQQRQKQELAVKPETEMTKHYKDWPNDAGVGH